MEAHGWYGNRHSECLMRTKFDFRLKMIQRLGEPKKGNMSNICSISMRHADCGVCHGGLCHSAPRYHAAYGDAEGVLSL